MPMGYVAVALHGSNMSCKLGNFEAEVGKKYMCDITELFGIVKVS